MSAMSPVHSHTMSYSGVSHSLSVLPAIRACKGGLGGERSVGGVTTIRHLKFKFQT